MSASGTNVAEVMKLRDLVAYQNGAIVSRTLTSAEGGTVTAFAFDVDQGLSEHTAPYDALVIVLEGDVHIQISGKSYSLSGGDMIIMPANEPHALRAIMRFKMLLIMIRTSEAHVDGRSPT